MKSDIKDKIPCCPHESKASLSEDLILSLDRLEKLLDFELVYTSGLRCPECNQAVGGKPNSAHLRGLAVDVQCSESKKRYELILVCLHINFNRIGIGDNFIHLDIDSSLPSEVIWTYK